MACLIYYPYREDDDESETHRDINKQLRTSNAKFPFPIVGVPLHFHPRARAAGDASLALFPSCLPSSSASLELPSFLAALRRCRNVQSSSKEFFPCSANGRLKCSAAVCASSCEAEHFTTSFSEPKMNSLGRPCTVQVQYIPLTKAAILSGKM